MLTLSREQLEKSYSNFKCRFTFVEIISTVNLDKTPRSYGCMKITTQVFLTSLAGTLFSCSTYSAVYDVMKWHVMLLL